MPLLLSFRVVNAALVCWHRCVVDWVGTWSPVAFGQVARELIEDISIDEKQFGAIDSGDLVKCVVSIHNATHTVAVKLASRYGRVTYVTPRSFLDLMAQ